MSPEKPTPQHDDEATARERLCWQTTETGCCVCVQDKGHESGLDDHCSHGVLMTCRRTKPSDSELAAALDVIGRRTDIVAVKLPEPTAPDFTGVEWSDKAAGWDVFAYGSTEHRGKVQVRIPEFVTPADARNAAAALYAAAALADAADGEAK